MLVPKDTSQVDYGNIFSFIVIAAIDGSTTEAVPKNELKKKRQLKAEKNQEDDSFELEGEAERGSIKLTLTWELISHDPRELKLKLAFDNPSKVSMSGYGPDTMKFGVKDYSMFKSAETGESMNRPDKAEAGGLNMSLPPIIVDEETAV